MSQTNLFGEPEKRSVDTDALGFLINFARRNRGQSFSAEMRKTKPAISAN